MADLVDTITVPAQPIPMDRTYLQMLRKLIAHFLGEAFISSKDPVLLTIAKALPKQEMDTKLVFLARPHSQWIQHVIMVGKSPKDVILDVNPYLTVDWASTDRMEGLEGYTYQAVLADGSSLELWPKFITTIREVIESGSIRYEVKLHEKLLDVSDRVKEGGQ